MSSISESVALAALSFTGQLLRPTDHGYESTITHFAGRSDCAITVSSVSRM